MPPMSQINRMPLQILMVEDNPGDVTITIEALRDAKVKNELIAVSDGVEALRFLRGEAKYANRPTPDLILLDLNLPKKSGREVLAEIKADNRFKTIPVVVLTSSDNEEDILSAYQLQANCYVTKPSGFHEFSRVIRLLEEFWFTIVKLPPKQ
jgi:two-component system, chemotaxis family, response regulator Rcp1